jgi:hypothetical protein
MQDVRARCLCQNTRRKGGNGTSRTSSTTNEANGGRLDVAGHEFRKDRLRARINWAKEQTKNANGDGIGDNIGD